MTTGDAIRAQCKECFGNATYWRAEVDACTDTGCALYARRLTGKGRLADCRKFCIQCMGGHVTFVEDCPSRHCNMWEFRFGTASGLPKSKTPRGPVPKQLRGGELIGR